MLRAVIIENEIKAQRLLSKIVVEYCPYVEVVGLAASIKEAKIVLEKERPDLVFLDIQLDDGDGFDLLDLLQDLPIKIIFTTAFDTYAIRAIKYNAIDYLLKPISPQEVIRAVQKVSNDKQRISTQVLKQMIEQVYRPKDQKLSIRTAEGIVLIPMHDIIRIEADGAYSHIYLSDGNREVVSKSIGTLEKEIHPQNFIRVHTSHIIHIQYLRKYVNEDGGYALMHDGSQVPVSRRRKAMLLEGIG